ncbi:IucA/IucC family protein [Micromonospora sp. L32]|uniref:IucA/IucC family protein n=1 Tax=Micromonospora sp. L32 TaxID=3452214 RepID=UPI003F8B15F7
MTSTPTMDGPVVLADEAASHTLLGCLTREVAGPEGQLALTDDGQMMVHLPCRGELLRVRVARRSVVGAHRFTGPVHQLTAEGWQAIDTPALAALVAAELERRTGVPNEEFITQVTISRDALARVLRQRPVDDPHRIADPAIARYVASEQALVYGHPRHPAPKWRTGDEDAWDTYAPELRAAFPMRWLGVPRELVEEDSADGAGFDAHLRLTPPELPPGHLALPVHPWQWRMLTRAEIAPRVARALADRTLVDLGEAGPPVVPTASVRTLYAPDADVFVKTSLHVRITNCLRKNSRYELSGAVHLTRLLAPLAARCAAGLPDTFALLPEPAYRTVGLDTDTAEALGVIVRTGLRRHLQPGQTPLLAGALATADLRTGVGAVLGQGDPAGWWHAYLTLLVPTVLRLWAEHGVVLEPHLQNVLVVVDATGRPVRVLLRDLEGTKLVTDRHAATLATLPPQVATAVGYDPERAWHRVAYCLFVNHLTELAGALADTRPGIEPLLWEIARDIVATTAADLGAPPPLDALLAGVPLPAKANLLLRWQRRADRHCGYLPFPNPLAAPLEPR